MKKVISFFLSLILVLGCTILANANVVDEPVTTEELIAESVVETLPEDMQNKDFEIQGDGFDTALVSSDSATAETIQGLIDSGVIVAGDYEISGLNVEVVEVDSVIPLVEIDGELYNAISGVSATSSYTSTYWSSGWYSGTENGMSISGRVYAYKYTNSSGTLLAIRPVTINAIYDGSAFTPTRMRVIYGAVTSYVRAYPGYLDGTDSTCYDMDYSITEDFYSPSSGTVYSFSTGMSNYCLQLAGSQAMTIRLFQNSTLKAEVNLVINL